MSGAMAAIATHLDGAWLMTLVALATVVALARSAAPPGGPRPGHASSCRTVPGLAPYLRAGHVIWFGELHGTEESPRFVGDVVCEAARHDRVQLGLEVWDFEQVSLDRYVRSAGGYADRRALLAGAFWATHDGRSSHAMVALLERVRALRAAGAAIELVAYDGEDSADRDATMADRVAAARDSGAIFVGLSGNAHARRPRGAPWDPDFVSMVAYLIARGIPVTSLDVSSTGGTMWGCLLREPDQAPDCGVHPVRADGGTTPIGAIGPSRDRAYDGEYAIGPSTASFPARP